jgi:glycosyltransferase involved in cell wall biosynthesis
VVEAFPNTAQPLSVLAVTNIYPTAKHPALGVFVEQQVKGLRALGLDVKVFYVDRVDQGMRSYFRMCQPLRAEVRQFRPALIHVMYGGVMAHQVTTRNWGRPTVVSFHGSDLLGENLSGLWRKFISRYGIYCSHRAARRSNGVVVVSKRLQGALPQGLEASKVRIIPCGIDLERFQPMDKSVARHQLGWGETAFEVLFPSNTGDPVKRPWLAEAAVKLLNEQGIATNLRYLRNVPNAEVPLWMNASDVLILTSAHEGSPTVVKEALACNVPVVSVNVGDVGERIASVAGCHLADATPPDLARKLRLVRDAISRVGGRTAVQTLSLEHTARKLECFYREIVAGSPARS